MQHKHKLAVALGFLAVLGMVEVAQARFVNFGGTRSAVARACIGPSREWTSGIDSRGLSYAMCVDNVRMTSVICDETGSCVGFVPNAGKPKPKPRVPRGNYQVPESLSESVESGEIGVDIPAPEPYVDIIN
jgi:hypothetical protein